MFLAFAGHFVLAEISGGAVTARPGQPFRNPHHVRHGVGDFVVQALRRQRCVANQKHRRQRRYGGRGRMRSGFWSCAGPDAARRSCRPPALRARRGCRPQACEVPAYLLSTDSSLPKVADAVKNGQPLNILVVGSRSSTIAASDGSAYPAQVAGRAEGEAASIPVNLSVELQTGKTAEEVAAGLVKLVEAKGLLWSSGRPEPSMLCDPSIPTIFAAPSTKELLRCKTREPMWFLINLQYSPRTETMISAPPYLDNMRVVAQQHNVPLFDRFAIMRHWNDAGDFDLFSTISWHRPGQTGSCLPRPRAVEIRARCGPPGPGAAELRELALMSCHYPFVCRHC